MGRETSSSRSIGESAGSESRNEQTASAQSVLVVGLGNVLMGDDGIGIRIIERIQRRCRTPQHMEILDGGTAGYRLIDYMEGLDRLVIVDAVRGGEKPGAVYRLTPDELLLNPGLRLSGHHINLSEVLKLAGKMGILPETVIIGIEPHEVDYGMKLSRTVEWAMERAVRLVMDEAGLES